jgi:TQXA domain-containing protein
MMTAQRQRGRRRAAATVAAIATAAGLVAGMAAPAGADSTVEFNGPVPGESGTLAGSIDGDGGSYAGGLFSITIDGEVDSKAYCIDILTEIDGTPTYDETPWAESGISNLAAVEAILRHYYPNGNGPEGFTLEGENEHKARATQAAIWHFTDGFELSTDAGHNPPEVIANYETILAAVADGLDGFGEPTVTLAITSPGTTEGAVGEAVGPYVVDTTADEVTVTASEGVTLVDSEGAPFTDQIVDGTELWLSSDTAGPGSITATASATATAGRVFLAQGQQTLILAAPVTVNETAEAVVSFAQAPTPTTSPPTTAPPTTMPETTTTVPITPNTSELTPPTTAPVTPSSGGGLPVTGTQSLILAAVALLLVALGVGFRMVSRRAGSNG